MSSKSYSIAGQLGFTVEHLKFADFPDDPPEWGFDCELCGKRVSKSKDVGWCVLVHTKQDGDSRNTTRYALCSEKCHTFLTFQLMPR